MRVDRQSPGAPPVAPRRQALPDFPPPLPYHILPWTREETQSPPQDPEPSNSPSPQPSYIPGKVSPNPPQTNAVPEDHVSLAPSAALNATLPLMPRNRDEILAPLIEAMQRKDVALATSTFQSFAHQPPGLAIIRTGQLHSLIALLAAAQPQLRANYSHMLTVVEELERRGPDLVREWEWNALMNASAKGFRRVTADDYWSAVGVLKKWRGALTAAPSDRTGVSRHFPRAKLGPSIVTYNILISIAAHTGDPALFKDALHRLQYSRCKPNRVTLISQLPYFQLTRRMRRLRSLVEELRDTETGIGTDGANALLVTFLWSGDVRTAKNIYDMMRKASERLVKGVHPLLHDEVTRAAFTRIRPDFRTHLIMLQAFAYRGDLVEAISVLQTLLSNASAAQSDRQSSETEFDLQMLAAFRALFISFVRHSSDGPFAGVSLKEAAEIVFSTTPTTSCRESPYSLETLQLIFRSFIELGSNFETPVMPSMFFVRSLLKAFRGAPGGKQVIGEAWEVLRVERLERCGPEWEKARNSWAWAKMRKEFGLPDTGFP